MNACLRRFCHGGRKVGASPQLNTPGETSPRWQIWHSSQRMVCTSTSNLRIDMCSRSSESGTSAAVSSGALHTPRSTASPFGTERRRFSACAVSSNGFSFKLVPSAAANGFHCNTLCLRSRVGYAAVMAAVTGATPAARRASWTAARGDVGGGAGP